MSSPYTMRAPVVVCNIDDGENERPKSIEWWNSHFSFSASQTDLPENKSNIRFYYLNTNFQHIGTVTTFKNVCMTYFNWITSSCYIQRLWRYLFCCTNNFWKELMCTRHLWDKINLFDFYYSPLFDVTCKLTACDTIIILYVWVSLFKKLTLRQ